MLDSHCYCATAAIAAIAAISFSLVSRGENRWRVLRREWSRWQARQAQDFASVVRKVEC